MYQENLRLISNRTLFAFASLILFIFAGNSLQAQVNRSGVDSTIFTSHTVFVPKTAYESGQENWGIAAGEVQREAGFAGHNSIVRQAECALLPRTCSPPFVRATPANTTLVT